MKRKTIQTLSIVAIICVATALLFATACKPKTPEVTTATVTYVFANGESDLVTTVKLGEKAIEPADPTYPGFEFTGWYNGGSKYDFSTPVNQNITLTAGWQEIVVLPTECTITVKNYDFLTYTGETVAGTYKKTQGEKVEISFKLSPYYDGEPVVKAGEKLLTANSSGVYSFIVESDTEVTVSGMVAQDRKIVGLGTEHSPYLIKNETQFEQFIARVNSASDVRYNSAFVRLERDLDLKGVEISPIGKELNSTHFSGVFDGNGHAVKNFEIAEEGGVIGLFGYLVQGTVKNLTVETDWFLDMYYENNYIVGGIVAYNMGGDIYGCNFNGSITTEFYYEKPYVFMGGITGFAQGYSNNLYAGIAYCQVNADFNAIGIHPLYAVGGIVGAMVGTAESAPVLVNNCAYSGDITGLNSMVGGIVGYMRIHTSVANCYSEGSYNAENESDIAAAGKIIGVAENECAVTSSYSCAKTTSSGIEDQDFKPGEVVGLMYKNGAEIKERATSVDGRACLELNNISKDNAITTTAQLEELYTSLGWTDKEWNIANGKLAVNVQGLNSKEIRIKINFSGESVTNEGLDGNDLTLTEDDMTVSGYYDLYSLYGASGINTFTADSGKISYGFFLDKECTVRIPCATQLTNDITVYVGFADYSEVQGEYYVNLKVLEESVLARIIFDDNGKMSMEYNGRIANYMYYYNGDKIVIKDGYFANFIYNSTDGSVLKCDFYAVKGDGTLTIYDNIYFAEHNEEDYAKRITAVIPSLALGKWFDSNGYTYTFNADGTGSYQTAGGEATFTYTYAGEQITILNNGLTYTAVISGSEMVCESGVLFSRINKFDEFAGAWEGPFSKNIAVTFDGKGTLVYGGNSFAYTIENGVLTFEGGSATFNESGLLVFTFNNEQTVMGKQGSFIGYWRETLLGYDFELFGIGSNGIGYGYDNQGITFTYTSVLASDGLGEYFLSFYYNTTLYGYAYSVKSATDNSEMLYAAIYTESQGALWDNYNLCYEDHFKGTWNSEQGISYDFNGLGRYDVYYDDVEGYWVVQGNVTVTEGENSETVRYFFSKESGMATFTYKGVAHTVWEESGVLSDKVGSTVKTFKRPDELGGIMFEGENILIGFNGKSNVGLGKAQISFNGEDLIEYDYTLSESGEITITKGSETYVGAINSQSNRLELAGDKVNYSLGLFSYVSNKTYIGGGGLTLTVNGYFDLQGITYATLNEDRVELIYMEENSSAVYYGGSIIYYLVAQDYYNVAIFDEYGQYLALLCVPDGWQGEYTATDGSVISIDGRGYIMDGYYSVLTLTDKDGTLTEYVYELEDDFIAVYLLDRNGEEDRTILTYILSKEPSSGAVAYVMGDVTLYLSEI